jgi:2-oxoisovalerate dehydrogenase E1 component
MRRVPRDDERAAMKYTPIDMATGMRRLTVDDDDWAGLSTKDAKRLATLLIAARRFEEKILFLDKRGLVHGPAHSSLGQEAGAAGCLAALPLDTMMNGSHRAHHQVIAKVVNALYTDNFDPSADTRLRDGMREETRLMMQEILGLKAGWTGGRGGSMHLRRESLGVMGTNAIVAGGLPIACGHAFAEKARGGGRLTVSFFGDGAIHQGTTHEAMHLAALYRLPVLFFCENNGYAVSTSVEQSAYETNLNTRPCAHGIESLHVDGMDPLAVWLATRWAEDHIRTEGRPAFVQADVYRYYHQSSPIPGSAFGYRTKEEEEAWRARSPWEYLCDRLTAHGTVSQQELDAIDAAVSEAVDYAADSCTEGKGSAMRIPDILWPDPATVDDHLVSDMSEFSGIPTAEPGDFAADDMREMTFLEAIPATMGAAMAKDPNVVLFGEDVANMGGGTVGATRGLSRFFGTQIINTPITENGFCGLAVGAAMSGMRPIIELMYSDFFLVAADQLFNQAGKIRHLFNGTAQVPLVLRCRLPGLEGYGSQHSMDPTSVFSLFPGWHILAPSNAFDYVGLMNTALRCNDPVLVIEPQALHTRKCPVPASLDHHVPIGRARRVTEGGDLTLLTSLGMVEPCVDLVRRTGLSADVIDLRSLSQRDVDYDLIGQSVRKTGRVAVIEQTTRGASFGAFLVDEIQRRFFDHLDQPVKRVTGGWAPPTVSRVLERAALAGEDEIEAALHEMVRDSALRRPNPPATV